MSDLNLVVCAVYVIGLCVLNIASIVRAATMRVYKNIWIFSVTSLSISVFMLMLLDIMYNSKQFVITEVNQVAGFVAAQPVTVGLIVLAADSVLYAVVYKNNKINIETRMIPFDLYDGLNRMSDGICFSEKNGIILMVNKTMYRISKLAFDSEVFNVNYVRKRLMNNDLSEGCRVEHRDNLIFLHLQDGSVWDIRMNRLNIGKKEYDEYIFYDITEKYAERVELNSRYMHLNRINERIREYHKNIDNMIREQ